MNHWLLQSTWVYPALETLHITGIALLLGSLAVFELRLLGAGRALAEPELAWLALPVTLGGFLLAAGSGTLLFAGQAQDMLANPAFRLKMLLLGLVGTNAGLFYLRGGLARVDALAKLQVLLSLLLWLAIIACGRAIAYV
ncbi:hypothetical protein [Niveibacterium sp. SC-1]|uniref:hypothetical protein n=1 Tax=Niveibacterium sp. SC-1 TaxID=3135646 RepID=UPI00311E5737